MSQYCLDANIFIEAKNNYYPLDILPAFWDWIDQTAHSNIIFSSSLVYQELGSGNDDLSVWMKDRYPSALFRDPSEDSQKIFSDISQYVSDNFAREEAEAFLSGADPWVIAQAIEVGAKVVTMEKLVGVGSRKVKIPNICHDFKAEWCNTFTMLRELRAKF